MSEHYKNHGRERHYLGGVQKPRDPVIHTIVVDEVLCESDEDLPASELVAVHVAHVLHHRAQQRPHLAPGRETEAYDGATLDDKNIVGVLFLF